MKTLNCSKVFESVNAGMKETKDERNLWKKEFCSLSKLLRDAQTVAGFKIVKPIFERYDLPLTRKMSAAEFIERLPVECFKEVRDDLIPAYVSRSAKRDEAGNVMKDKEGNVLEWEYKLTPVRVWTLDKFVKVLATAEAAKK